MKSSETPLQIRSVFDIGYKCESSDFLEALKIRKYSSPFSYMVIDMHTALDFIDNRFKYYVDPEYLTNVCGTCYKFLGQDWGCYYIHKHSCIINKGDEVLDSSRACIWNHHDLNDKEVLQGIGRRYSHLLHVLDNRPETLLLFYIEKLQVYNGPENVYVDISRLRNYKCNFIIVVPLLNFDKDPQVVYDDIQIRVIHASGSATAHTMVVHNVEIQKIMSTMYTLDIDKRD
jgi:hypothetical protein